MRPGNTDPNELTFATQNPLDEEIWFESFHRKRLLQPMQWLKITCPPGQFVQLPHAYYTVFSKSGRPITLEKLFGAELEARKARFKFAFTPDAVRF